MSPDTNVSLFFLAPYSLSKTAPGLYPSVQAMRNHQFAAPPGGYSEKCISESLHVKFLYPRPPYDARKEIYHSTMKGFQDDQRYLVNPGAQR